MKNLLKIVNLSSFSILFETGADEKEGFRLFFIHQIQQKKHGDVNFENDSNEEFNQLLQGYLLGCSTGSNRDHQKVFMICKGSAFTNPRVWGASQFFPPSQSPQFFSPSAPLFFKKHGPRSHCQAF